MILSLIIIPVPFFLFWLWGSIIFIFHLVCFPAVNFIARLVMAVHFVAAIEVFAQAYINLMAKGKVECISAVSRISIFEVRIT